MGSLSHRIPPGLLSSGGAGAAVGPRGVWGTRELGSPGQAGPRQAGPGAVRLN